MKYHQAKWGTAMPSITITTAFITTQFTLLIIVSIGFILMRIGDSASRPSSPDGLVYIFLLFALATLGFLVFSEDIVSTSKLMFSDAELPSVSKSTSFRTIFILDLLGSAGLIFRTGGAKESPFSAVLCVPPTIAIFLREPAVDFILYSSLAACLFIITQRKYSWNKPDQNFFHMLSFNFVTLGCLGLTTFIGYVTRPI